MLSLPICPGWDVTQCCLVMPRLLVFAMFLATLPVSPAICHVCLPQVFGFFATIVFAIDFYLIFNEVAKFLKQGDSGNEATAHRTEGEWPIWGFS